jgi:two-component system, LytTR family, response regulator
MGVRKLLRFIIVKAIQTTDSVSIQSEQTLVTDASPFVFVRDNNYWLKIAWDDILYLKSDEHCVLIATGSAKYTIISSLAACEKQLPLDLFRRVHRSYIINVSKIDRLNKTEIVINDQVIPLSRTFADALFQDFVWARLLG